jgi:hypothetical protein
VPSAQGEWYRRRRHRVGGTTAGSCSVGHATLGRDGQESGTLHTHADALLYAERARRGAPRRARAALPVAHA